MIFYLLLLVGYFYFYILNKKINSLVFLQLKRYQ